MATMGDGWRIGAAYCTVPVQAAVQYDLLLVQFTSSSLLPTCVVDYIHICIFETRCQTVPKLRLQRHHQRKLEAATSSRNQDEVVEEEGKMAVEAKAAEVVDEGGKMLEDVVYIVPRREE